MKRLFLAIKFIPSPSLAEVYNALKTSLPHEKINWVAPSHLHLTLKFFGETPEDKIPSIKTAVTTAIQDISDFSLQLQHLGIFGSSYNPRVVWVGIEKEQTLLQLEKSVRQALEQAGWIYDRQNFVPHLTLGRVKNIADKKLFQQIINTYKNADVGIQKVNEIILFESILHPQCPIYKEVESFGLVKV